MLSFRFEKVHIEAFDVNLPEREVTSEEMERQLAPLYERLKIPFGTLEKLTGIRSRYFWGGEVAPSQVATVAALKALEHTQIPRDAIQALFSCSITRDYFEPATACLIHNSMGLRRDCLVQDISNACLGFMNGMLMMANLIESGAVKAGIVVSGESIWRPIEYCIRTLLTRTDITRDQLIKYLPTLTLGSGAVAYVMCHKDIATSPHRLVAAVTNSASEHHTLCSGNGDYCILQPDNFEPLMETESSKLIAAAAVLGGETWPELSRVANWSRDGIDHVFCHQVGKQVNQAFYDTLGLDIEKEFTIYPKYGNLASAALPTALVLGSREKTMRTGEKVVLTGFGSGLNAMFMGIEW
jgi:3-oxoacyl-[acyl-carrier-protein] synthase III